MHLGRPEYIIHNLKKYVRMTSVSLPTAIDISAYISKCDCLDREYSGVVVR